MPKRANLGEHRNEHQTATARRIATFWSTPAFVDAPHALAECGFASDDRIIAVVYLGYPAATVETPHRPPVAVTHLA